MGNYEQLKESISQVITENGNNEITGLILQNVLTTIVSNVGANATFAGIATPSTNPGTPDQNVFYIASEGGTYANFNSLKIDHGIAILYFDSGWKKNQMLSVDADTIDGSLNMANSGNVNYLISKCLQGVCKISTIGETREVEEVEQQILEKTYITDKGIVSSINDANYKCGVINVTSGEMYRIRPMNSGEGFYGYAFYKDSNLIIGEIINDYVEVIVPEGANKLYVSYHPLTWTPYRIKRNVLGEIKSEELEISTVNNTGDIIFSKNQYIKAGETYVFDLFVKSPATSNTIGLDMIYADGSSQYRSITITARKNVFSHTFDKDCRQIKLVADSGFTGTAMPICYRIFRTEDAKQRFDYYNKMRANLAHIIDGMNVNKVSKEGSTREELYIDEYGRIRDITADYSIMVIPCSAGDAFDITTKLDFSANYSYIFCKNDDLSDFICGVRGTVTNDVAIAPYDAKYLVVNYQTSVGAGAIYTIDSYGNKEWSARKWACVGDSLTEVNDRATERYYDYISEKTGIQILNYGLSGTGYAKPSGSNEPFYQRISTIDESADLITIFGSFNDISSQLPLGTPADLESVESICGKIRKTLNIVISTFPTKSFGVIAPTPWDGIAPENTSELAQKAQSYVQYLTEICNELSIPILDLYHKSNLHPNSPEFRAIAYSRDNGYGTHPDEVGHKIIAPRIYEFIKSLMI